MITLCDIETIECLASYSQAICIYATAHTVLLLCIYYIYQNHLSKSFKSSSKLPYSAKF